MEKLCCIPCSDTPEIDFNVNCICTCCDSKTLNRKASRKERKTSESAVDEIDNVTIKTYCCCIQKRSVLPKCHAMEGKRANEKDECNS